jgi:anti-sigma factor RsiW
MRCSSSRLLFEGLLDGTLAARAQASLSAHLERCADCHGLLEEVRVVDALLLHAGDAELPSNFTTSTMAAISAIPAPRSAGRAIWGLMGAYLAAAWVLIALALIFDGAQTRAALGFGGAELAALGGLAHGLFRGFDSVFSSLTAVSVGALVLDVVVGVALLAGYKALRRSEVA